MANKKITDLTALTTAADGDILPIVDVSDTIDDAAGTSKKITRTNFFKNLPTPSASTDAAIMGSIFLQPQGSVSDWDTDVTNIQAAIDSGYEVKLGEGTFYIGGKNGANPYYLFLITGSKKITGSGMGKTILLIQDTVDNATDIFRIAPTAYTPTGMEISSFSINPYSTTCARHAIHIDLTSTPAGGLSNFHLHHVSFHNYNGGAWNGNDVYLTNPTLTDGMYVSKFTDNEFNQGLYFNRLGDSTQFVRNRFAGYAVGCTVASMVAGATICVFDSNNAWIRNGVLKLDGVRFVIKNNNFETDTGINATVPRACIDIDGNSGGLAYLCTIEDNSIHSLNNDSHAVFIDNAEYTHFAKNYIVGGRLSTDSQDIYLGSGADHTYMEIGGTIFPSNFAFINNGTDTKYTFCVSYPVPVLATGTGKTVDNVITALQSIGLFSQT